MFKFHIRGKNGKNRTVSFSTVFTGGRPFFSTISAAKTVKIENFMFFLFSCGVAKGYPLAREPA